MPRKRTEEEFLASLIERLPADENGCWIWQGAKNQYGYGVVGRGPHRVVSVHRLIYELHVGPIPEGLHIDHLCKVRACANPAHLEPVTLAENNRRAQPRKIREFCVYGGHPLNEENTYIYRGHERRCRACRTIKAREWQRAKRAKIDLAATVDLAGSLA